MAIYRFKLHQNQYSLPTWMARKIIRYGGNKLKKGKNMLLNSIKKYKYRLKSKIVGGLTEEEKAALRKHYDEKIAPELQKRLDSKRDSMGIVGKVYDKATDSVKKVGERASRDAAQKLTQAKIDKKYDSMSKIDVAKSLFNLGKEKVQGFFQKNHSEVPKSYKLKRIRY